MSGLSFLELVRAAYGAWFDWSVQVLKNGQDLPTMGVFTLVEVDLGNSGESVLTLMGARFARDGDRAYSAEEAAALLRRAADGVERYGLGADLRDVIETAAQKLKDLTERN